MKVYELIKQLDAIEDRTIDVEVGLDLTRQSFTLPIKYVKSDIRAVVFTPKLVGIVIPPHCPKNLYTKARQLFLRIINFLFWELDNLDD